MCNEESSSYHIAVAQLYVIAQGLQKLSPLGIFGVSGAMNKNRSDDAIKLIMEEIRSIGVYDSVINICTALLIAEKSTKRLLDIASYINRSIGSLIAIVQSDVMLSKNFEDKLITILHSKFGNKHISILNRNSDKKIYGVRIDIDYNIIDVSILGGIERLGYVARSNIKSLI